MVRRRRRWRRTVLASAIIATCTVGLLALVWLFLVQGAHGAAEWASVIGALIAAAGFATPLVSRAMRRIRSGSVRADQSVVDTAAEELARALQVQWRDEARNRRLQDPRPMQVPLRMADYELADHVDLVFTSHGDQLGGTASASAWASSASSDVAGAYERLPHKRLVVLGSLGAGKSILAIILILGILEKRQVGSPVPVLFSVGSWDPSRISLHDWMVNYLAENYELSGAEDEATQSVAEKLLTEDRLLPILDGLDEMPSLLRPAAIEKINRSLDEAQAIVLTCRTSEYRDAVEKGDVLTLAAVIELLPLDLRTITAYLAETAPAGRRASQWGPVFDHLKNEPHGLLATVLRNPLMLSLARTI
jgi:NACHT domain